MSAKVIASLQANIGANITSFKAGASKVKSQLGQLANSFSSFAAGPGAAFAGAVSAIGLALKGAIDETLKYDSAVRQLAEVSGTSAEEASRLLQVMDDFKITADDVNAATRAMTKEGLSPTLETLAQLSDQYNLLNPGQERAEFLMKNFGRTGLKFAEAMEKGGDALKQMGTEVEKSLIRTDAQIAKTRLAEFALDRYQDKVQAVRIELGTQLIGALDGSSNAIGKQTEVLYKQTTGMYRGLLPLEKMTEAQRDAWHEAEKLATEEYLLANGMDITAESADGLTTSIEEQAEAMKATSEANRGMLGLIGQIQGETDSYNESMADLSAKQDEQLINIAEMTALWGDNSQQVIDAKAAYAETGEAIGELAAAHQIAMAQIAYDLFVAKLSVDGLTTAEYEAALAAGVSAGLIDESTVAMAKAWDATAQSAANAVGQAEAVAGAINAIPTEHNTSININTNYSRSGVGGATPNDFRGYATGTTSAAPGFAWVGENGPELVGFKGGETVISNQESMGASSASKKMNTGGNDAMLSALLMEIKKLPDANARALRSMVERTGR